MTAWLERYCQGEYEQVWTELLALGEQVQRSGPFSAESFFYAEALEVARETMRRARYNIELLVTRLPRSGYQFGYHWLELLALDAERRAREAVPVDDDLYPPEMLEEMRQHPELYDPMWEAAELRRQAQLPPRPFAAPSPEAQRHLDELEHLVGSLPLSVRAWYEVIGSVDFVGTAPPTWSSSPGQQTIEPQGRPASQPARDEASPRMLWPGGEDQLPVFDPLYVYSVEGILSWVQGHLRQHHRVPPWLALAPDAYGKIFDQWRWPVWHLRAEWRH